MKLSSLLLFCCLLSLCAFSQKTFYGKSKYFVFLDKDYAEVPTKDSAVYVRVFLGIDSVKESYEVRDYTMDGKLLVTAHSSNKEYLLENGLCTWYNSKRQVIKTGYYSDAQPTGEWTEYYDNGQMKQQYTSTPKKEKINNTWDSTGKAEVINGEGSFEIKNDKGTLLKGRVTGGVADGTWETFGANGQKKEETIYAKGKFIKGFIYDETGKRTELTDTSNVVPQFIGGEPALKDFLRKTVHYPRIAQENAESGTVVVQFIVNKDGALEKISIQSGVSEELNKESLRVVRLMPKWIPAKSNGKNVAVLFRLPIKFTIK